MPQTDDRKKKYPYGSTACGIGGMLTMMYLVNPSWGEGILGAGLECGIGWALGAGAYGILRYIYVSERKMDEIRDEQKP